MKLIASSSALALTLSLISQVGLAGTVNTGATTMSQNAVPSTYSLFPYITVTTSPYIAQQTAFDASDIWSQQSTMNEDLFLLHYKQDLEHSLERVNASLNQRPILEISGAIEGMALQTFNNFTNGGPSGDINLNTAELDFNAMASRWATAFMSIEFDSSPPSTGNRVQNSRLYLSRGFATIGDLDVAPFYFTIGQMYLPFGRYSSNMVTTPETLSLARVNDRAMLIGYARNGLYASLYTYPGIDANAADTIFHAGGANLGYKFKPLPDLAVNIGGGLISDMTASQGIGNTGAGSYPAFPGFTNLSSYNIQNASANQYPFAHVVPGGDFHTEITYGLWSIALEYLGALTSFASQDLTYNGSGAQPSAAHVEVSRNFLVYNQTYTAGVAYGRTWESVGLNLPQQSITGYLRTSFWKNTIESLEFRHNQDYGTNNSSTAVDDIFSNVGTGKGSDMILGQLGVYF
jgi:hypothetical protein